MKKHFIDLDNFTLNELRVILNIARDIKLKSVSIHRKIKTEIFGNVI